MIDIFRLATPVALAAASFSNTVSLGSTIIVAILALATLIGIIYGAKWKSRWDQAQATIELYAQNAKGHEDRADLAQKAMTDLAGKTASDKDALLRQLADSREEIGRLRGLPDVAALVELSNANETRAQERHEATLRGQEAMLAALTTLSAIHKKEGGS